jgi:hypothetical protein
MKKFSHSSPTMPAASFRINRGEVPGPRVFASEAFLQKVVPPLSASFHWTVNRTVDARAKTKKLT